MLIGLGAVVAYYDVTNSRNICCYDVCDAFSQQHMGEAVSYLATAIQRVRWR